MTLFAINIKRSLVTCLLFWGVTLASVYEEGDTISEEHQNVIFEQCYGYDEDGEIKLEDYLGKVLWFSMDASWCAPSWDAICEIDELTLQWINEPNVENFVSLSDLGNPYSCEQWGDEDITGIPIIVDGGAGVSGGDILFNWFNTDAYPSYVFIDHTMTVRHMINNADFSVEQANQWIEEMLDNIDNPPDTWGCTDSTASNYNPVNTTQEAGYRSVQWNATDMHGKPVSAGVYLYQIRAGEFVQTKKMVLLK